MITKCLVRSRVIYSYTRYCRLEYNTAKGTVLNVCCWVEANNYLSNHMFFTSNNYMYICITLPYTTGQRFIMDQIKKHVHNC